MPTLMINKCFFFGKINPEIFIYIPEKSLRIFGEYTISTDR
jgi:nitric oxide synthase oxygenase domain/subunit